MTQAQQDAQAEYLATNQEIEKLRLEISRTERHKQQLVSAVKVLETRAKGQRQRATGVEE